MSKSAALSRWGTLSPIRSITDRRSLFRQSFTRYSFMSLAGHLPASCGHDCPALLSQGGFVAQSRRASGLPSSTYMTRLGMVLPIRRGCFESACSDPLKEQTHPERPDSYFGPSNITTFISSSLTLHTVDCSTALPIGYRPQKAWSDRSTNPSDNHASGFAPLGVYGSRSAPSGALLDPI